MSPLQSKHLPYQIHSYPRVTVFTLEEAKGHGLRVMTRVGGKGAVAKIYGMPLHPPPSPPQNLVKSMAPSLEGCFKPRVALT